MLGIIVACKKKHTPEQCVLFRKIFDKKLKAGVILFQNEGAPNIHERLFPNHHNNKGKGHVLMVFPLKKRCRRDVSMQPEREPDLEKMAL